MNFDLHQTDAVARNYADKINTRKFNSSDIAGMLKVISLDEAYLQFRRFIMMSKRDAPPSRHIFKALALSSSAQRIIARHFGCKISEIAFGDVEFKDFNAKMEQQGKLKIKCPYKVILGHADFEESTATLGELKFVGGYADFRSDAIGTLPKGLEVGGRVFLTKQQLNSPSFADRIEKKEDGYNYMKSLNNELVK